MTRVRIFAMLAIALTAGGTLAFGTYNLMKPGAEKVVAAPTQPVIVADADLALGDEVKAESVRVVQWPLGAAPEGAFARTDDVVGRGVLASVVRNEPLLEAKLAPRDSGIGLPPVIPPGMRAMSVRVNEVIGVAGYVLREDMTSKLVLPNVQVLTAGTKLEQDADKSKPMQVSVVTLLVTPDEAEKLTLASTEGKIQLALRNPLDKSTPATSGVRPAVLLGAPPKPVVQAAAAKKPAGKAQAEAAPAPPLPAPAPATVEIIRGDKRTNEAIQ
jgi:pilus assembly protein CpaB